MSVLLKSHLTKKKKLKKFWPTCSGSYQLQNTRSPYRSIGSCNDNMKSNNASGVWLQLQVRCKFISSLYTFMSTPWRYRSPIQAGTKRHDAVPWAFFIFLTYLSCCLLKQLSILPSAYAFCLHTSDTRANPICSSESQPPIHCMKIASCLLSQEPVSVLLRQLKDHFWWHLSCISHYACRLIS